MTYPLAINEDERLQALHELQILDTPTDPAMSAVCADAAEAFGVPIALVSLIDRDRQWFKARFGLDVCETERRHAFCNYTVTQDRPFVVEDTLHDSRFANNIFVVGEPRIRFYAGSPLFFGDNIRLGAFCLIDTKPRAFADADVVKLQKYAKRIVGHLWRHDMSVNGARYEVDGAFGAQA